MEKEASPSLVWQDATTGRKAVSYSRLLATLVAAFQVRGGRLLRRLETLYLDFCLLTVSWREKMGVFGEHHNH